MSTTTLGDGNISFNNAGVDWGTQSTALYIKTAYLALSGTSVTFNSSNTSIGSASLTPVKRVIISFNEVSLSGTDNILVQIGDSTNSRYTTGYVSTGIRVAATTAGGNSTTGFIISSAATSQTFSGHMELNFSGIAHENCVSSYHGKLATTLTSFGAGHMTMSGNLKALTIASSGTNTFDGGSVSIIYMG